MKRSLAAIPLICLLLFARAFAAAGTTNAYALGIELCPQYICGSAIFTGILNGEVGGIFTSRGTFTVSVNHDALPTYPGTADITGGSFQLRAGTRTFKGAITGGTLIATTDPDVFDVVIYMSSPTAGPLEFIGTLSHKTFPPTISGQIFSVQ